MLKIVQKYLAKNEERQEPRQERILARAHAHVLTDHELDEVSGACCGTGGDLGCDDGVAS